MKLVKLARFDEELEAIVLFITEDSPDRALVFFDLLIEKIHTIPLQPYAYRKRKETQKGEIRELIYKGYTVPFLIDKENESIVILGIFNQNLWNE